MGGRSRLQVFENSFRSHPQGPLEDGHQKGPFTNSFCLGISFFVGFGEVWGPIFPGYVGKTIEIYLPYKFQASCQSYPSECPSTSEMHSEKSVA